MSLTVLKPWYQKGLRFKCTECGKCCSGKDGYVILSKKDISSLCAHFNLSKKEFLEKYTYFIYGKIVLKDLNRKGDCIFLKEKRCTVYKNRPTQCKTFPWWPSILENEKAWEKNKETCEGIDHPEGETVSLKEIQNHLIEKLDQDD